MAWIEAPLNQLPHCSIHVVPHIAPLIAFSSSVSQSHQKSKITTFVLIQLCKTPVEDGQLLVCACVTLQLLVKVYYLTSRSPLENHPGLWLPSWLPPETWPVRSAKLNIGLIRIQGLVES